MDNETDVSISPAFRKESLQRGSAEGYLFRGAFAQGVASRQYGGIIYSTGRGAIAFGSWSSFEKTEEQ